LILKALFGSGLLRPPNLGLEGVLLPHFLGSLPRRVVDVSESIVTEERIRVKRDSGEELEALHWDHDCAQTEKVCQFLRDTDASTLRVNRSQASEKTQQNEEEYSFRG
jgi:hypothetical protein